MLQVIGPSMPIQYSHTLLQLTLTLLWIYVKGDNADRTTGVVYCTDHIWTYEAALSQVRPLAHLAQAIVRLVVDLLRERESILPGALMAILGTGPFPTI